ncbi:MAG: diguanylate cyclase [Deltaproteobacteria bacterium]|nr:sigma 54-interacting transcriptional regulator [Deltaproteobacteria bacterium]MBW2082983.1 sigma 54-interacting transcriptional regulator [Deltaproteobacteria bacterium]RLB83685.1 MAG: diguanylate cyclase [Deltaproteobacteria bacterium]HDM10033.1 PAS domain S-box protein [Desulfobacteraceae bacterium]
MQIKFDPNFARLLWESMADGVFTLDSQGIITSWNPAMERISGYGAEEVLGKSCSFLNFNRCFGRTCPTGLEECGILRHEQPETTECFLTHKDGYDVPVVKCARVVRGNDGQIMGVVETVTDLTELKEARKKAEEAISRLAELHRFDKIIGKSHGMQQVFSAIRAAASSDATVLLQGESGTGKELVAGAIHYNSPRSRMPFVTVNCSALSESLLESELFGHIRGAFTGAIRDRKGRFEEADGGAIFLDEVGEISPYIQVKLLRVLQEKEIERVGESLRRKIDIRIIAATNKDLLDLVRRGHFREDLYYRLKVFPIQIPPLRTRKEDIPLLVSHFVSLENKKTRKRIRGVSQAAMRILMDYDWPGNVRELQNAIEHAFVLCDEEYIDVFDLPLEIRQLAYQPFKHTEVSLAGHKTFGRVKLTRERLLDLLDECDWNKAEVARQIGMSRTAVWKYMKKWSIPLNRPS